MSSLIVFIKNDQKYIGKIYLKGDQNMIVLVLNNFNYIDNDLRVKNYALVNIKTDIWQPISEEIIKLNSDFIKEKFKSKYKNTI